MKQKIYLLPLFACYLEKCQLHLKKRTFLVIFIHFSSLRCCMHDFLYKFIREKHTALTSNSSQDWNLMKQKSKKVSYLPFRSVRTEKYLSSVLETSLDRRSRAASTDLGNFSTRTSQTVNNL